MSIILRCIFVSLASQTLSVPQRRSEAYRKRSALRNGKGLACETIFLCTC